MPTDPLSNTIPTINVPSPKQRSYPLYIFFSIAIGHFMINFIETVFTSRIFNFYEVVLQLRTELLMIATLIWAIYNMFNDPIVGFITDRPRKFWKKWGKRVPYLIGVTLPWMLFLIGLFAVPSWNPATDQWQMFFWLLRSLFLYDTFFSIYETNYNAIIPDKFRSNSERLLESGIGNYLSILGVILATLMPIFLGEYSNQRAYLRIAIIVALIGIISVILQLPGMRETTEMKERAVLLQNQPKIPFFHLLRRALKHRNFVAYLVLYMSYQTVNVLISSSLPYFNQFVLKGPPIYETYMGSALILSALVFIPIWIFIAKRWGYKRVFLLNALLMTIFIIPLFFASQLWHVIVIVAIIGMAGVGFGVLLTPIMADVIDEAAIIWGTRQDSFYMGVRIFFARISFIIYIFTSSLIHIITGFEEHLGEQTDLAIMGIRFQIVIIPILIICTGIFTFWRLYDLGEIKKEKIQAELRRRQL